ncbi:hypothetical protein E2C01_096417 [Portunus trituberculatus]|uniref:Uncharacterized protein n=1 Tax=Portunus trituberculatus TaxID=210409 RepID=A0A5B7JSJ2_PORTR|nr:hypothetical protein [Portunus trituberculatus]
MFNVTWRSIPLIAPHCSTSPHDTTPHHTTPHHTTTLQHHHIISHGTPLLVCSGECRHVIAHTPYTSPHQQQCNQRHNAHTTIATATHHHHHHHHHHQPGSTLQLTA